MVFVVFRSRWRPDADQALAERLGQRMHELATAMPGFVSYKDFANQEDGEQLTHVEFEDDESLLAWRNHPEHLAAQEAARRHLFSAYEITVGHAVRRYRFDNEAGRRELPL
jgi:heme-degrading monooxygenase HmoA